MQAMPPHKPPSLRHIGVPGQQVIVLISNTSIHQIQRSSASPSHAAPRTFIRKASGLSLQRSCPGERQNRRQGLPQPVQGEGMNILKFAITAVLGFPIAILADEAGFRLSASVKVDSTPIQQFSYIVQPGQVRILDLPFGALRVELAAREKDANAAQAYVRLLQLVESSGAYLVLHEAYLNNNTPASRDFAYLVCGRRATFISPAPAEMPECKQ